MLATHHLQSREFQTPAYVQINLELKNKMQE
jgi:hypothetical protein